MDLKKFRMSFECPKCGHFHQHFESTGTAWRPRVVCVACSSQFRAKLAVGHSLVMATIISLLLLPFIAGVAFAVGSGFSPSAVWLIGLFAAVGFSSAAVTWLVSRRYVKRFVQYEVVEANAV